MCSEDLRVSLGSTKIVALDIGKVRTGKGHSAVEGAVQVPPRSRRILCSDGFTPGGAHSRPRACIVRVVCTEACITWSSRSHSSILQCAVHEGAALTAGLKRLVPAGRAKMSSGGYNGCMGAFGKILFGHEPNIQKNPSMLLGNFDSAKHDVIPQLPGSYPYHQDLKIIPSAPPSEIFQEVAIGEENDYTSKNILLSKDIPSRFKEECASNFGPDILFLAEKVILGNGKCGSRKSDQEFSSRFIPGDGSWTVKRFLRNVDLLLGRKAGPQSCRAEIPRVKAS